LIPTALWLHYDFLSLKNDVNVPSKRNNSNKHKNLVKKKILFVGVFKVTDEKGRMDLALHPDPLVKGTAPARLKIVKKTWLPQSVPDQHSDLKFIFTDPDPSINKQKMKKNPDSYCFVASL
jgi:hypothetical protein